MPRSSAPVREHIERARQRRSRHRLGPVTAAGVAFLVLGIAAYVAGWQLGWIELMVVAGACLLALLIAVPFVIGRSRVSIERTIAHDRISVGELLQVRLRATNPARTPSRPIEVAEWVGTDERRIRIPSLGPGAATDVPYEIRPMRRSRLQLGPAVFTRSDPLGLLRRDIAQSGSDVCWVYPTTRLLGPLPVGFAKDLEGPTSDTSPAGDVAFHTIRPYVTGDDQRHIHWMSTAKTGSLMVRHYVDNRRPHLAVLLDTAAEHYDETTFETAVSVCASLTTSMLHRQMPISVRVGDRTIYGATAPGHLDSVMEQLTLCETTPGRQDDLVIDVAAFLRAEPHASALVIVTGSRPAEDLMPSVLHARRRARVVVATAGVDAPGSLPSARVVPAATLDRFAAGWGALVS